MYVSLNEKKLPHSLKLYSRAVSSVERLAESVCIYVIASHPLSHDTSYRNFQVLPIILKNLTLPEQEVSKDAWE